MTRGHFVYWMFDADGDCLYVGITIQPTARWKAHRRRFGTEVATKRMAGPYTKPVAQQIEREQIASLRPKYDAYWGAVRERERRRQEEADWPVYSIAELAQQINVPEDMLRDWAHPATHFRIPDDSEWAIA